MKDKAPPEPVFSRFWARGFEWVLHPMRRRHLEGIGIQGLPVLHDREAWAGQPLMLVANHAGNWDGFLLRALQKHLRPQAPLFSVMREDELRRRPLFRRIGGVGVQSGSTGETLRLLRQLEGLRKRHSELVLSIFPQGTLRPAWQRPLGFRGGVLALAKRLAPVTLLPVSIRYENLKGLKPTALLGLGQPYDSRNGLPSLGALEGEIAEGLDALAGEVSRHGESLPETWVTQTHRAWWKA